MVQVSPRSCDRQRSTWSFRGLCSCNGILPRYTPQTCFYLFLLPVLTRACLSMKNFPIQDLQLLVGILIIWAIAKALFLLVRWMYPPSPGQLHFEALEVIERNRSLFFGWFGKEARIRQAELLLKQALDGAYKPARLSLEALYYQHTDKNAEQTQLLSSLELPNKQAPLSKRTSLDDPLLRPVYALRSKAAFEKQQNQMLQAIKDCVLKAGYVGTAFVAFVLLLSACRMFFIGGNNDIASTSMEYKSGKMARNNQTCYSAYSYSTSDSLEVLSYPFNGTMRQSPLPRYTCWQDQAGPDEWRWPSAPRRTETSAKKKSLWYYRGVAYDLSNFAQHHPGGYRYILNTANRDITELFEAHHIGTTAQNFIDKLEPVEAAPYSGHSSRRFKALKKQIAAEFDLNDLKIPSTEYTILFWTTVASHLSLFGACLVVPPIGISPWLLHTALGYTSTWLGGFAHNGLHLWPRRKVEAVMLYTVGSNNPFRWMQKHIVDHHMYTNTAFDADKPIVSRMQKWTKSRPWMDVFALTLGTFLIGLQSSCCQEPQSETMTPVEQLFPLFFVVLFAAMGLFWQGRRWIPRFAWTTCIMCCYSFIMFQVSHYQPGLLDGDAIHATTDDWGTFQLRTTQGWQQLDRPLLNLGWIFLNLQPGHHLFPAVHHSKLYKITPLIRLHYPGLMDDQHLPSMLWNMFGILLGWQCQQQ